MATFPTRSFSKPAQSPQALLNHLKSRGLVVNDEPAALLALETIGYYRLLIYMRPLQQPTKIFPANTSFDAILNLYEFDRKLRLLCLDAIERIEVALRAALINTLSLAHDPHFYLDRRHFTRVSGFKQFLKTAADARYLAIEHHENQYHSPPLAPIWAITEAITFGKLSILFADLTVANRKRVAKTFKLDEKVLASWFRCLNIVRNMCAHHNRLWNFHLRVNMPIRAKAYAAELTQLDTFYSRAVVMRVLLKQIAPNSDWHVRLAALIDEHNVSASFMGFPPDWQLRTLWQS